MLTSSALHRVLAEDSIWEALYLRHVAGRCGMPPASWKDTWLAAVRRRWLRSVCVDVRIQGEVPEPKGQPQEDQEDPLSHLNPWYDPGFCHARTRVTLKAEACVPPEPELDLEVWKTNALVFKWILPRERWAVAQPILYRNTLPMLFEDESRNGGLFEDEMGGLAEQLKAWEEIAGCPIAVMREPSEEAWQAQLKITSHCLETAVFNAYKPLGGRNRCRCRMEPRPNGDVVFVQVIEFNSCRFDAERHTETTRPSEFLRPDFKDPILLLRRKDFTQDPAEKSPAEMLPYHTSLAANSGQGKSRSRIRGVQRALRTAIRAAFKASSSPGKPRKQHRWMFHLKWKVLPRIVTLGFANAMNIPACDPDCKDPHPL